MIDMRHELVRLARLIDWKRFDEAFGALYAEKGRPGSKCSRSAEGGAV
jgi:IS5 family transposase